MITFDNIDAVDGNMDCFLMADGTTCQKPLGYALDVLKLRKATREYDACVQAQTTGVTPCVKPVGYDLDLLRLRPASKAYDQCLATQGTMLPPLSPDMTLPPSTDGGNMDTRSTNGGASGLSTGALVGIVAGSVVVLGTITFLILRNRKK
jgi:hypothetical protein